MTDMELVPCAPCQSTGESFPAVKYCITCSESLCRTCVKCHMKFGATKSHRLVDCSTHDTKHFESAKELSTYMICPDHDGRTSEILCEEHDALCCLTCATITHRKCRNVSEINKLSARCKTSRQIDKLRARLEDAGVCMQEIIDVNDICRVDFERSKDTIPRKLEETKMKIMKLFERIESAVLETVKNLQTEEDFAIGNREENWKLKLNANAALVKMLGSIVEIGTESQVFVALHKLKGVLLETEKVLSDEGSHIVGQRLNLKLKDKLEKFMQTDVIDNLVAVESIQSQYELSNTVAFSKRGYDIEDVTSASDSIRDCGTEEITASSDNQFLSTDELPIHMKEELRILNDKQEAERKQKEQDKSICKRRKLEQRLTIHKEKTLSQATDLAYKLFELDGVVSLDCCRIVKYDDFQDTLECSFEEEESTPMEKLLGGIKQSYSFDLLLETKRPEQKFQAYKPGSVTVKVFVADMEREIIIEPPVIMKAYLVHTVEEFKNLVAQILDLQETNVRCVLEGFQNNLKLLLQPTKTLKSEGFLKTNKVYIESRGSAEDQNTAFQLSRFYHLLDRHQNTIRIHVNLPLLGEVEEFKKQSTSIREPSPLGEDSAEGIVSRLNSDIELQTRTLSMQGQISSSDPNIYQSYDDSDIAGDNDSIQGQGSYSQSSQLTSTSASYSVNSRPNSQEVSPMDSSGDPENSTHVQEARTEFHVVGDHGESLSNKCSGQRSLTVFVDKRITLGAFKYKLEPFVQVQAENFKVFRVYSNNQEFERIRLGETLSFLEDSEINIKLGRALKTGEYRVKVFQLLFNNEETSKFLVDTIFAKGMTVMQSKKLILAELKMEHNMEIPLNRCRLRKKTWKNPGTIYMNEQVYEDEIPIYHSWEFFLEVLEEPEKMLSSAQLAVYARRWLPSKFEIGPFEEVLLKQQTLEELKQKLSELSGLAPENIEIAKGRGSFPYDVSQLEFHTDLDWNPPVTSLGMWPLYICDDGCLVYYRDSEEQLLELDEEKRKRNTKQRKCKEPKLPFLLSTLRQWNLLEQDIRDSSTLYSFKRKLNAQQQQLPPPHLNLIQTSFMLD